MTQSFSIIIPVYNAAPYLRECLDSVLAQTYTDWEAIVVDDGSTDGSAAILNEFAGKDNRFHMIHQANAGSSVARNAGLDYATGEWVWFVDADDTVDPSAMETFINTDSKADINFFGARVQFQDGFCLEKRPRNSGSRSSPKEIDDLVMKLACGHLGDVFGWTWDKFIRREVIERHHIRFDTTISYYEDEVFAIQAVDAAESLATLRHVLYNYRILDSGLTAKGIPDACALAQAFTRAGINSRRESLRYLVDSRVTNMLRRDVSEHHSLRSAKLLLQMKRSLSGKSSSYGGGGGYAHLLQMLCRLPLSLSSILLVLFHSIKK